MTKQNVLFSILFAFVTLSAIDINAKTESLSLDKIKSSEEIFHQHMQKVDSMNPDNGQEIKRYLNLSFKAANIKVTEYVRLISTNKHSSTECFRKACAKARTFCMFHHMDKFHELLSQHDSRIAQIVYENIIIKYSTQHRILKDIAPSYLSSSY